MSSAQIKHDRPNAPRSKEGLPAQTRRQQIVITALFLLFAIAFSWTSLRTGASSDLLPIWLAAKFFALGQEGAIYAKDSTFFTMSPPNEWIAYVRSGGSEAAIYPYVYPPLWAKLLAPLTNLMSFAQFERAIVLLNPALLILMIFAAWRAAPKLPLQLHMLVGTALIFGTTVGLIPIIGGQAHILVGFLMVLAMERSRNNAPISAGAALAIATAFKLFPLVFVIFFITKAQWRAVISFAATGAILGGASLLLAGWPLHAEFLSQISAVSRTMLFVNHSINIDGLIGHILGLQDAVLITQGAEHLVLEKSPLWIAASRALMIGVIGALGLWAWRNPRIADHPLIWPTGFLAFALVSPLSWTFYYAAPLAMAPYLLAAWGAKRALLLLIPLGLSLSFLMLNIPQGLWGIYFPLQVYATIALIALLIAYVFTISRETRA
ncbi:MAG: glycosyltransferase family 87 protein [Paracoccaceae bacterium]